MNGKELAFSEDNSSVGQFIPHAIQWTHVQTFQASLGMSEFNNGLNGGIAIDDVSQYDLVYIFGSTITWHMYVSDRAYAYCGFYNTGANYNIVMRFNVNGSVDETNSGTINGFNWCLLKKQKFAYDPFNPSGPGEVFLDVTNQNINIYPDNIRFCGYLDEYRDVSSCTISIIAEIYGAMIVY